MLAARWPELVTSPTPGTGQCSGVYPQGGRAPDFQQVPGSPVHVNSGFCTSEHVAREPGPLLSPLMSRFNAAPPWGATGLVADAPWDILSRAVPFRSHMDSRGGTRGICLILQELCVRLHFSPKEKGLLQKGLCLIRAVLKEQSHSWIVKCVHMCMCVYMYECVYVSVCACVCAYAFVCLCACICV